MYGLRTTLFDTFISPFHEYLDDLLDDEAVDMIIMLFHAYPYSSIESGIFSSTPLGRHRHDDVTITTMVHPPGIDCSYAFYMI